VRISYLPNEYSQQRQREKKRKIYPVLMAMQAEYYRRQGHHVIWDSPINDADKYVYKPEDIPFSCLPPPDREFTQWWKYQDNGNFKYHPATYIMSAIGCLWGGCTFCVENNVQYQIRILDSVIDEIRKCKDMGFREVFDDSATFHYLGYWFKNFCKQMKEIDIKFSCNMRMVDADYSMMKEAGFRMLLFGLESANQRTLDKIGKGTKVEDIKYIIKASKAGLEPHIAVMFGYPWETDKEAKNTLELTHYLLRKGYAKTAQASFYSPNGIQGDNIQHRKYVNKIYGVWKYPEFWYNKITDIKCKEDIVYLWTCIKAGLFS